jgi:hypothetical protein
LEQAIEITRKNLQSLFITIINFLKIYIEWLMNSMKGLFAFLLLSPALIFSSSSATHYDDQAYQSMDALALQAGTDKGSSFHNYTKVYSQYFKFCRNEPIRFLEIGIYKGDSVKFWESYFPKADLHFMDITADYIQYYSDRSKYHYLDQSDLTLVQKLGVHEGPFDIILDDGGHTMAQQINSLIALFPSVKSGGLYIIEDLHTSYWKSHEGSGDVNHAGSGTAIGFLKNLIDDVNFPGAASYCADYHKLPASLQLQMNEMRHHIEAIHFYTSVCIIEKR